MGLYADTSIFKMEAGAGADIGYEPGDRAYSNIFGALGEGGQGFEKGSTARRAAVIWGLSAVWLVLVWRAVRGF